MKLSIIQKNKVDYPKSTCNKISIFVLSKSLAISMPLLSLKDKIGMAIIKTRVKIIIIEEATLTSHFVIESMLTIFIYILIYMIGLLNE
tara:strand:- start:26 stop:292 length:267 start_codon:yes stop_codon:yes gene_type:complete